MKVAPYEPGQTRVIHFTEKEAGVILDRLELNDCIAEALTDVAPGDPEPPYDKARVETTAYAMKIRLTMAGYLKIDSQVTHDILVDAIDGATFGYGLEDAVSNGEMTPAQAGAWKRVMASIVRKLNEAGIDARFPTQ